MKTYIIMCVEAQKILKNYFEAKPGDRYITKANYEKGIFKLEYITDIVKPSSCYYIPYQEDLQKIYLDPYSGGLHISTMESSFHRWYWEIYGKRESYLEQHDWNILWLCFLMEVCFSMWWTGKYWRDIE